MRDRWLRRFRRLSARHFILAIAIGLLLMLALIGEENMQRARQSDAPLMTATIDPALLAAGGTRQTGAQATRVAATPLAGTPLSAEVTAYPAPGENSTDNPPSTDDLPQAQRDSSNSLMDDGLWLPQAVVEQLPTHGAAWEQLQATAVQALPQPDVYDKDDDGDVLTLARALVYARTGEPQFREAVVTLLQAVMSQEIQPRRTSILSVARNIPGYVIAADLIDLPADEALDRQFRSWLRMVRDTEYRGDGGSHTLASCHETRPNNFGSHCGAARLAIALYLNDEPEVQRAANVFHGWLGNRDVYAGFNYGRLSWQADPQKPVAINPPGATKEGRDIGGALPEEMRRAGDFRWPPKRTGYVWEALQGALVQAELLSRAGYDAWQWEDRALLRAVAFLYDLGWEPNGDDTWQPWLINYAYGAGLPATAPARAGKNIGWTDWTHSAARAEIETNTSWSVNKIQSDLSGETK